jgi:hypothetical protein
MYFYAVREALPGLVLFGIAFVVAGLAAVILFAIAKAVLQVVRDLGRVRRTTKTNGFVKHQTRKQIEHGKLA